MLDFQKAAHLALCLQLPPEITFLDLAKTDAFLTVLNQIRTQERCQWHHRVITTVRGQWSKLEGQGDH